MGTEGATVKNDVVQDELYPGLLVLCKCSSMTVCLSRSSTPDVARNAHVNGRYPALNFAYLQFVTVLERQCSLTTTVRSLFSFVCVLCDDAAEPSSL